MMPEVGVTYRFEPSFLVHFKDQSGGKGGNGGEIVHRYVDGRIFYVNAAHRYFAVEFDFHGTRLVECFKCA